MPPKESNESTVKPFKKRKRTFLDDDRFAATNVYSIPASSSIDTSITAEELLELQEESSQNLSARIETIESEKRTAARPRVKKLDDEEKTDAIAGHCDYTFETSWRLADQGYSVDGGVQKNKSSVITDRVDHGRLTGVRHLTAHDRYDLAYTTAFTLQNEITAMHIGEIGSTALNVVADLANQSLIILQLGTAHAFLRWIDQSGKSHLQELHDSVHTVTEDLEINRLTDEAQTSAKLNITRALGCDSLEKDGLIHIPTVRIVNYANLRGAKEIRVLMFNEGVTQQEKFKSHKETRNTLKLPEYSLLTPMLLTKMVLAGSLTSDKNASVIVMDLPTEPMLSASAESISCTILTGCGDASVAEYVRANILAVQQQVLDDIIARKYSSTTTLQTEASTSTTTASTARAPVNDDDDNASFAATIAMSAPGSTTVELSPPRSPRHSPLFWEFQAACPLGSTPHSQSDDVAQLDLPPEISPEIGDIFTKNR